jgi:Fic family protein
LHPLKNCIAERGISQYKLESEKRVWLHTFSDPFTTAKQVSGKLGISPNTARNSLNTLAEKMIICRYRSKKKQKMI